jgi:hypothetical protein
MAKQLLKQVKIASPCHVAWSEMQGDDQVRYCSHCKRNVFNFSAMPEDEAEAILRQSGNVCGRIYRRVDGTVLVKDCPVGVAAVRKKLAIGLVSAAAILVSAFGLAVRPTLKTVSGPTAENGANELEPGSYWDSFSTWLTGVKPKQEEQYVLGFVTTRTPPPPFGGSLYSRGARLKPPPKP